MRKEFILEHSFSDLGLLQKAHTVRYGCMDNGCHCDITVQEGVQRESCRVYLCRQKAEMLVRFLYENAVSMENWQDVVADMTALL